MICAIVKERIRYWGISDYLGDEPGKVHRGSNIWVSLNENFTKNLENFVGWQGGGISRVKIMTKNIGGKK